MRIVVTSAFVAGAFACSVGAAGGTVSRARHASPQAACGVATNTDVSEEQAICVAQHAGLKAGKVPLYAQSEVGESGRPTGRWLIHNIQGGPCPDTPRGEFVAVAMKGGRVGKIVAWDGVPCEAGLKK
jgi:hypothetical protein